MTISRPDDEPAVDDLVLRAKTEREAFGALYDLFFPMVHRYCRRRLFGDAAADDVSSEVFLQAARAIRGFPGKSEQDFRRWLYRIATNALNAHLRHAARRGELFERAVRLGWWSKRESVHEPREPACDKWDVVTEALARLSPREQTVLALRFMEGLSNEEAAAVLNMRTATMRVVVSRAIKNLQQLVLGQPALPLSPDAEKPTL